MSEETIIQGNDLEVVGSRELSALEMQLAREAEEVAAIEKDESYTWISIKGKKFTVDGAANKAPLKAVIMLSAFENVFYGKSYDSKNAMAPDCAALGYDEKSLAPYAGLKAPQHTQCKGCAQNKFGSGKEGRGKACKNDRRLLLIADDDTSDTPTLLALRLPPMSVQNWGPYVKRLSNTIKRPYYAVVTHIDFDPSGDVEYPLLTFTPGAVLTDDQVMRVMNFREYHKAAFVTPFIRDEDDADEGLPAFDKEEPKKQRKFAPGAGLE